MIEIIRKTSQLFDKSQKRKVFWLIIIALIGSLIETITVAMIYPLMNAIIDVDSITTSEIGNILQKISGGQNTTEIISALFVILSILYLLVGMWQIFQQYIRSHWLAKIRAHLSGRLFKKILEMPYSYHLRHSTAEMQRLVTEDTTRTCTVINALMDSVARGLTGVGIFIALFIIEPVITTILIVAAIGIILLLNKAIAKLTRAVSEKNQKHNTQINRWVYQAMGALKNILVNRRGQMFLNQYIKNAQQAALQDAKYETLSMVPKASVEYGSMTIIFLFLAIFSNENGNIGHLLPTLATFAMAAMKVFPILTAISGNMTMINYRKANVDIVYKVLFAGSSEINHSEETVEAPERKIIKSVPLREGVKIQKLGFAFSDSEQALYDNLNLFIPANHSVAFIGVTGSGKTTLADIILGLHKPFKGKVLADGHDVHKEKDWWADQVGYIPQSIYLCEDTIRANVAFACHPDDIDDKKVWKCLKDAQLKEFVEALPKGLDTEVGENGVRLSGGQRQRIGIARALYFEPQFLVMDEATSALDGETEQAIIDSINRLAGKKTLLIIAHRLSTIRDCDMVYRIENGTAVMERSSRL